MGVDLLAKYLGDAREAVLQPPHTGPCIRLASKPPSHLVLHYGDGERLAIAYNLLQSIAFNKATDIVLKFGGTITVTLKGRRLKPVFQSFMDHLVQACIRGDERMGEEAGLPFIIEITTVSK